MGLEPTTAWTTNVRQGLLWDTIWLYYRDYVISAKGRFAQFGTLLVP
jgi:hypothetical protein